MRRSILLLAVTLSSAIACSGSDTTRPMTPAVEGSWNLNTVNGSALPYTLQATNPKIEVLSDQISFATGGTFTETGNFRVTDAGLVSMQPVNKSGTWTVNGTALTFTFLSGSTGTGTVSGSSFTVSVDGFSRMYSRQ
jgi:hypothetical protein